MGSEKRNSPFFSFMFEIMWLGRGGREGGRRGGGGGGGGEV